MAGKQGTTSSGKKRAYRLTMGDVKMLACVGIFFVSVMIKYADTGPAVTLRTKAANLLHGGMEAQEVMQVLGHLTESGGLQSVFAQHERLAQVFGIVDAADGTQEQTAETADTTPADTTAEMQADSGYEEDLIDRTTSNFPKEVDDVAYVMAFSHVKPTEGTLTSAFGTRVHPISGTESFHYGIDVAAAEGKPIDALADGTVRTVGESSYGKYVIVDHTDGFSTLYAHCSAILVQENAVVTAGQEIAQVGATGIATGNHLHLEVWHDGKALNPANYVQYEST